MSDIQDYKSTPKFETFSYLPAMTPEKTRRQIAYIVSQGWNPGIEHVEPERAFNYYWYMWKLPMFGETDVDVIMKEAEACRKANPNNHIRLLAYDNYKQSQGTNMVIFRGKTV